MDGKCLHIINDWHSYMQGRSKDNGICNDVTRPLQVAMERGRPSKGPFVTERFSLLWFPDLGLRIIAPDPFSKGHRRGLDLALTALTACTLELPSPAQGLGCWRIVCSRCRVAVSLPTSGHRDDPSTVRLPCRLH